MTALPTRYDRNIRLFGEDGQRKLRAASVVIAGVGGLGSPLVQHLALLGVGRVTLIDDEELDETNRNRFVGARHGDQVPGSPKVALAGRLVQEINPDVGAVELQMSLVSEEALEAVKGADWVFGCFDDDGPRYILNELCAAYGKPYIDSASGVPEAGAYGGRVCVAVDGDGCLACLNQLDERDVRLYLATEEERAREAANYGIPFDALGQTGPSVSPVNGVIASLAATEFMVVVTGMRRPVRLQEYRGQISKVVVNNDRPRADCYYCKGIRGTGATADAQRYLRMPQLRRRGTRATPKPA
jgi:molybdopterin/thiamine biosynthesis adenylyltransferase